MIPVQTSGTGLTFWIYVQPRASKAVIVGAHQDALKIKLTAPPVEGAANKQCIEILAEALHCPKSRIEIVSGQTSRRKQVRISPRQGSAASEIEQLKERVERLAASH